MQILYHGSEDTPCDSSPAYCHSALPISSSLGSGISLSLLGFTQALPSAWATLLTFIWEMPRYSQVSQGHHFLWKPSYTRLGVPPLRPRIHCPPGQCDLACSTEKSLLGWSRDSTCCSHIDGGRMSLPRMLLPGRNSLHLWGSGGPGSQLAGDWPAQCFRLSDSPGVISIRSVPAFCSRSPNPSPEFELSWSKWAGSLAG